MRDRLTVCLKVGAKILFASIFVIYGLFALGLVLLDWWGPGKRLEAMPTLASSKAPHQITLHDRGTFNFKARMDLIRSARESLELEFFIYNIDDSARFVTQELIRKAESGVKVRILVDFSAPVLELKPLYARYLKSKGIEVKYYNQGKIYRFVTAQHRSHRKLLIADGKIAVMGGRNIGDEYFDFDPVYNFLDSDLELRGPLVAQVRDSFELYWKSEFSREPDDIDEPLPDKMEKEARQIFDVRPDDQRRKDRLLALGTKHSSEVKTHVCRDLTFVTDFPNQGEKNRRVYPEIIKEVSKAKKEIIGESPYFVIRSEGYRALKDLTEQGIKLTFLTNGLYSTDATYSVASLFFNLGRLARTGMTLYAYDGSITPQEAEPEFSQTGRWGVHSKRAVIDGETVLIGTYNVDPRSANLNSELMLVCRHQPALAAEVLQSLKWRLEHARKVAADREPHFKALMSGAGVKLRLYMAVMLPLANLFDFLL